MEYSIGNRCASLFLYADNIWVSAKSQGMLCQMLTELCTALQCSKLPLKPSSLQFLTNQPSITVERLSIPSLSPPPGLSRSNPTNPPLSFIRVTQMEVLGTIISMDGRHGPAVAHRLARANRAFLAQSKQLCDRKRPLMQRLQHFHQRIIPIARYGSGSWSWSITLVKQLRAWELLHLRKMHYIRKPDNLDWPAYWKTSARTIRSDYEKRGFRSLSTIVLATIMAAARVAVAPSQCRTRNTI